MVRSPHLHAREGQCSQLLPRNVGPPSNMPSCWNYGRHLATQQSGGMQAADVRHGPVDPHPRAPPACATHLGPSRGFLRKLALFVPVGYEDSRSLSFFPSTPVSVTLLLTPSSSNPWTCSPPTDERGV